MKRIINMLLTILILSTAFTSCQSIGEKQSITDTQSEFVVTQETESETQTESETDTTQETTTENEPIVIMDLKDYLSSFTNHFHYPRKAGDKPVYKDILNLVSSFCFTNRYKLSFVDYDEKRTIMTIKGEDFRNVAKNLLGEDFDANKYNEYFINPELGNNYDKENDVYSIFTFNSGGNWYTLVDTSYENLIFEEDDSSMKVITTKEPYSFIYNFDKVIDDGFMYYRIGDIYWNTDPVITDTWLYETQAHEITDYLGKKETYTVSIELPYYLTTRLGNTNKVWLFDYVYGGNYSTATNWMDQSTGFAIIGYYEIEEDSVFDETIIKQINDYLTPQNARVNQTAYVLEREEYDVVSGKTDDGKDYIACLDKPEDEGYFMAYGYVRVTDDLVIYLGFFRETAIHRDYILDAIKSVRLGEKE